ncbi:MAG: TIGR03560 family F420-dependent LLM class oxidoreductase [Acidimicrobiia bacterium]
MGPSGAGKSTWADLHFAPEQIVSTDHLRAMVGESEEDLAASTDAFALLEQIVRQRVGRRLTTVIDTLGLDPARRAGWVAQARSHGLAAVGVVFPAATAECRARNRARNKIVPERIVAQQVRQVKEQRDELGREFDIVITPKVVRTVPSGMATSAPLAARQAAAPIGLRFGLQIPSFTWPGGAGELRTRLRAVAAAAETAGFDSIWVMDHFRQIPMFGPAWHDMLESYTTLAYLAAHTERARLGTLVTGITYRNVAHLAKIIATLDVLSGGRAMCGLGLGWFRAEHDAYGWEFPPVEARYARLEDALQVLPMLWGKGAPAFHGRVLQVPDTTCYPRPVQEHLPMLVGGNGELRTLRLAAQYADSCNIIGDVEVVMRKVAALRAHCDALGRDRTAVEVTQLSTTLVGRDAEEVARLLDGLRPRRQAAERYAASVNAGTVADQIGRFRALADAGVGTAIVSFPDLGEPDPIERFAGVIAAFR